MTSATLSAAVSAALTELRTFVRESGQAARIGSSAAKHLIVAAIKSGPQGPERVNGFKTAQETLYAEIRANANGLARSAGAVKSDDGKSWVIPGHIRTQVSQVARALKYGVDLGTPADPVGAGEMRKRTDKAVEKAAEEEAAKNPPAPLTGDALIRSKIDGALKEAAEVCGQLSGEELSKALGFVAQLSIRLLNLKKGQPTPDAATPTPTAAAATAPAPTPEPIPTPETSEAVNASGKKARVTTKKKAARRISRAA